jgi:hypothetical protein
MSTDLNLTCAEWIKSSYSQGDGGQCVEFSPSFAETGSVPVRDSKNPSGPALAFPAGGWSSFVAAVQAGELPAVP